VTLIEAVGVGSLKIGGELHPITACPFGDIDRRLQKLLADAPSSEVWMNVHRLHLRTQAPAPLEVTKHDELAHSDDLAVELSDQNIASARSLDLGESAKIIPRVRWLLSLVLESAVLQEGDQSMHITLGGTPNDNGVHPSSMPVTR
jgi:hypothetical protein